MYDLHLSPEQIEFRDTVRDFVNAEVKPVTLNADRLDKADRSLPMGLLRQASRLGLRTLALPEDLGGVGADALTACIVTEELAAGDADIAAVLSETSALARRLFAAMSPGQRDRFLPAFVEDDDCHLALADREPGADTALGVNYHRPAAPGRKVAATAARQGDALIVNGVKVDVANAPLAKLIAVSARGDQGTGFVLVPRDAPGVTVTETPEPRWYHGSRGTVELKECRVPAGNWLAPEDIEEGREWPWRSALNLGVGRAAYEAALEYAGLRVQGGRPIVGHQAIGLKLADVAIRLDVARTMVWRAAYAADHPEAIADRSLPDLPLSTVARIVTSEAVYRAAKDSAECFGAMGVMRDMPLQKYIHDARICLYSGDGNADLRLRIAEQIANFRRGPSMQAAE
jgi:alkylation response protein AidB-like acyl-CoA dehydrogenase